MSIELLISDAATVSQDDHPATALDRLPSTTSLLVYSADQAEKLYPWWTPSTATDRLQRLAQQVRGRNPVAIPLAIIYATDGSLFGVAPIAGELYGFLLPAARNTAAAALGTPEGLRRLSSRSILAR